MQGEKHKVACNLSRVGAARVHTRRLARASRVVWWEATMQGEKHKAARNLSRAGAVRVHTRRLARASRVVWWHDL